MPYEADWTSLLPPFVTIALAIATKRIFLALGSGILLGSTVREGSLWGGLTAALKTLFDVATEPGNAMVVGFCVLVGALISLLQRSGGVRGLVDWISERGIAGSRRKAGLLAWTIGVVIFIESSITSLVTGTVCRPLFDRFRISREKLAYICDSTSAPVCILIPLNGWGAFISGLLLAEGIEDPFSTLIGSTIYNFYPLITLLFAFVLVVSDRDFGPMASAQRRAAQGKVIREGANPLVPLEVTETEPIELSSYQSSNMLIPLSLMIVGVPLGLWVTGDGNLMRGSGTKAVFFSVVASLLSAYGLYLKRGLLPFDELLRITIRGIWGLRTLAGLMILAFAIGDTFRSLETGQYLAKLAGGAVQPFYLPALLFVAAACMSFATGTSWGTFAAIIPLGLPVAMSLGIDEKVAIGAMLSGGVFGDHCSPLSDTTIIASMAAATDHIDHVKTQLPYALIPSLLSVALFLLISF